MTIGGCVLDPGRGLLSHGGRDVPLRPKTRALLLLLLEEAGRPVTRDAILDAIWGGLHVTDDSITQCVVELRRALGPEAWRLKTLPRRGYLLEAPPPAPALPRGVPVVAVLPLRLPVPDPALALFAEGVVDGVVGALAARREPVVISANSTRALGGAEADLPSIGRRLGAGWIVSGQLRPHPGGLRLSLELAEAATAAVAWRRNWDLPAGPGLELEEEVAGVIAHGLAPRVEEAELRRLRARPAPGDPAAYHLLLEARALVFRLEHEAFEAGGALLRRAVALDPGFPPAHAALADWHSLRLGQSWSDDPAADLAGLEEAAAAALALDSANPRALALAGHNRAMLRRAHEKALPLFERALEAAPNDPEAWMWSVPTHSWLGRHGEALHRARRALALSPEDPLAFRAHHFMAIAHYEAGELEEAAEWGLSSRRAHGRYASNLRLTAAALAGLGRESAAREVAREAMAVDGGFRVGAAIARHAGRNPAAREALARRWLAAGLPP
ncbi:winged helix-turn-helix domain-containing protein [Roseococcus sp. DSY-14]|uniref:winged helix-turn-helix domain-containing protein n=1 Tax=Roseococcus sp. DSY-14 TaxID=3369650 RepID=UPI00387B50BA